MTTKNQTILLAILDGKGIREETEYNAIKLANTPNIDYYEKEFPTTILYTSGNAVGLPEGVMGNSEVGHMNIGAGRIIWQDNTLISKLIDDGSFFHKKILLNGLENARKYNSNIHLMGLVSDGGVHSVDKHYLALLEFIRQNDFAGEVFFHVFTDGRDTPPDSSADYVRSIEEKLTELKSARIVTVSGRYYAMDRDKRWDRIETAYNAITYGKGIYANTPQDAIKTAYDRKETDEFIKPTVVSNQDFKYEGVQEHDTIIFFNFRADRARQLTSAYVSKKFEGFQPYKFKHLHFITFTGYQDDFNVPVFFERQKFNNILGEVLSHRNKTQLRISETEKYAHVTYFFNGGREEPFKNEDRILIPSPNVPTYDLKPEMSAYELTNEVVKQIQRDYYDLIVLNFPNCDMVGHTGNLNATIKAVETVDKCVKRLSEEILKKGGVMLMTADHGNAELMFDKPNNVPHTAHTTSPVKITVIGDKYKNVKLKTHGILADIAVTILDIMKIDIPKEMTASSILLN